MEQYKEDGMPQNAWDLLDPERNMSQTEDARSREIQMKMKILKITTEFKYTLVPHYLPHQTSGIIR